MASVFSRGRRRSRMISSSSAHSPQYWHPLPSSPTQPNVSLRLPPSPYNYSLPETQRPDNLSVARAISGRLPRFTPTSPSSPHHPSILPPLPKSIPAWQTTWDFTSPLKSAASGNHSSRRNVLVFKGLRDWGGNWCRYILPFSSWLLFLMLGRKDNRNSFF